MKQLVRRTKVEDVWCSVYASVITEGIWNLGLIINKSKRASNDWYQRRPNKRTRRAQNEKHKKSLKQLRACLQNVYSVLHLIPTGDHVLIVNDHEKAQTLSKYVTRLGFMKITQDDQTSWVLTAHQKEEALRRYEHTKQST